MELFNSTSPYVIMMWCTLKQKEGLAYATELLRTISAHQHETSRIAIALWPPSAQIRKLPLLVAAVTSYLHEAYWNASSSGFA